MSDGNFPISDVGQCGARNLVISGQSERLVGQKCLEQTPVSCYLLKSEISGGKTLW